VLLFTPLFQPPAQGSVPAIPPPPAAAFGQTIPPGGATVRVFEEKREEEEATEQSQAFAAYRAEDYRGLPIGARAYAGRVGGGGGSPSSSLYLLLAAVLAAGAGASIGRDPRRRNRQTERPLALASARTQAARAEYPHRRPRRRI